MNLSCKDVMVKIASGELEAAKGSERLRVQRHLRSCADCREYRDWLHSIGAAARESWKKPDAAQLSNLGRLKRRILKAVFPLKAGDRAGPDEADEDDSAENE